MYAYIHTIHIWIYKYDTFIHNIRIMIKLLLCIYSLHVAFYENFINCLYKQTTIESNVQNDPNKYNYQ